MAVLYGDLSLLNRMSRYGRKIFGSLSPVWTRLGIHGLDVSDPASPVVVHAFLPRDAAGYSIVETWDTLGMRPTRSDDTLLEGTLVPDRYVGRVVPAGYAGIDAFVLGVLAWTQCIFAAVYLGIAERAFELAVAGVTRRTSVALDGRSMATHPMIQYTVAEMAMELEVAAALTERTVDDWSAGVDHGDRWLAKLSTTKHQVTGAAARVVDLALEVTGGAGMFRGQELERLYRDVRCGGFHPLNSALVHEVVAKAALGLRGTEPRW